MRVEIVDKSGLIRWQAFVDAHGVGETASQHAGWYAVLEECFSVKPYFLQAENDRGEVEGILPLYLSRSMVTGTHLASLYGGALCRNPVAVQVLFEEAFRLRDRLKAGYLYIKGGQLPEVQTTLSSEAVCTRIAVLRDAAAWREALPRKTRKAIRLAEEAHFRVRHDDDAVDAFYRVYAENMRDLGTPVTGPCLFHSMRKHLKLYFRLYVVELEGKVVGGLLCINDPKAWFPLYASVLDRYKPGYPNYLLYWTAMADAAATPGVNVFDMGRSTIGSGNHFFKQKWKGEDNPVFHTYFATQGRKLDPALTAMRSALTLKQRIWSHLPLALANRIGPAVRKQLPFA